MVALPHNIEAEESLLGAMLLSQLAIDAVAESVVASDFYKPSHSAIYESLVRLRNNGKPCDSITVAQDLSDAGLLGTLVERATLVDLQTLCPSTANVSHYAKIVLDHSLRRRMMAEGRGLVEQAADMSVDATDVLDTHKATLATLGSTIISSEPDDVAIEDFVKRPRNEIAPWVVPKLIRKRHKLILVGAEGAGKALDIQTPVATPTGWTTIGDISVGDFIFDELGEKTKVVATTEVMYGRPCYDVVFNDGSSIVADAEHRWVVVPYEGRQQRWCYSTVTTSEMAKTIEARDGFVKNYAIDVAGTLECDEIDLPIHPYVLGAWLGDGTSNNAGFTSADEEVVNHIRSTGYAVRKQVHHEYAWWICNDTRIAAAVEHAKTLVEKGYACRAAALAVGVGQERVLAACHAAGIAVHGRRSGWKTPKHLPPLEHSERIPTFMEELRNANLLGNKHIPPAYLRSAPWQRLALLQGLMDTDGYIDGSGAGAGRGFGGATCEFTSTNRELARSVHELVLSLGIKASLYEGNATLEGRIVSGKWRVQFQTDQPVFRLTRKLNRITPLRTHRAKVRYVTSVTPVASVPVRCIQVSSESGCFLAGKSMIPTHNSWILRYVAICAAYGVRPFRHTTTKPVRTLVVDLENPEDALYDSFELILRKVRDFSPQDETINRLWWRPAGINLRNKVDVAELENVIRHRRPDLVCLGPLYAAYENSARDFGWETAAREVQATLKRLMVRYDFALMIEDHAPQGENGAKRQMRPYGSSFWRRWPDIGIGMETLENADDAFRLTRWRGDRVPTDWPTIIERGTRSGSPWPFIGRWENDSGF